MGFSIRQPGTAFLVALAALGSASVHIVLPSIPSTARDLETTTAAVQASLTAFTIFMAFGQLVYGPVSDRIGRRRPLLFGLSIYVVGSILCTFASSPTMLIVGRMLQGAGGCAGVVLSRAIVRDMYQGSRAVRALAHVSMGVSIAPILSPLLGGQIDVWFGWRTSFGFLGAAGLLTLMAAFLMKETQQRRGGGATALSILGDFALLLRIPAFRGAVASFACSALAFFTFITAAPVIMLVHLHYDAAEYGLFYMAVPVGFLTGSVIASRLATIMDVRRQIALSVVAASLAALAQPLWIWIYGPSAWALFVPFSVLILAQGVGWSAIMGLALSADPTRAGSASGLLGFSQMASASVATQIAGLLGSGSALLLSLLVLGFSLAAMVLFLAVSRVTPVGQG
jgi:DHA1 family bicyclomycin/chloramphenicol resistance-like MFS transporter